MKKRLLAWWLREMREFGLVPIDDLYRALEQRDDANLALATERRLRRDALLERDEARAFINSKLQALTQLEPVLRWAKPQSLGIDYWKDMRDFRAIDEAFRYIAKAAAHKIESTLRFGLSGERP